MATITSGVQRAPRRFGLWLLIVATVLALVDAIYNYYSPANGIHGTEGALLVIISTVLQLIAALLIAGRWLRGWVWGLFEILILLDLAGTALAAYLLEAWVLLALTAIGFIGWLVHLFEAAARRPASEALPSEVLP